MKILIGTYALAEGARDSDEDAETTASQSGQVAALCRAVDAQVFPRGNRIYSFTFTKTREHADFKAAEEFRLLHALDIPATGYLKFVTEDGSGAEGAVWFLQHNLDQVRIRQIGVSTLTTYAITAARPVKADPTTS